MEAEPSTPTSLPEYLARYATLGFDTDDIATLLSAIDSSQALQPASSRVHLPAEILLLVLEHVPGEHVLCWRAVCRAFRDAIDGRILWHHLQRVQLIGLMGPQYVYPMDQLEDEQYDRIHLLRAHFHHAEPAPQTTKQGGPAWTSTYAVFQIDDGWYQAFRSIGGAGAGPGGTVEGADPRWLDTLEKLELRRPEEGYGSLRWAMQLDHAVLDLDFPLEPGRNAFHVDVCLHRRTVRVAWKDMLVRFLKTEASLKNLMDEKESSVFTFSHSEDCLRAVRRMRLHSSLDLDKKADRHLKWSLRLLTPLFGQPGHEHALALADVEDAAVNTLLLLRREAALSRRQIAYLHKLKQDHEAMQQEVEQLDQAFQEFKAHFCPPSLHLSLSSWAPAGFRPPRNPVSWSDDVRCSVEERVKKWRNQKRFIDQVCALLSASNQALSLDEDSFDISGSQL